MLVTLVGKNSIHKLVLPKNVSGNYWLSDKSGEKEKKLVNIEEKDGRWQVVSNNNVKIINLEYINIDNDFIKNINPEKSIVDKAILKEYSMYGVTFKNSKNFFILYCSPVYETNYVRLDIKNFREIQIGSSRQNQISYNNKVVAPIHTKIFYNKNRWSIENYDNKFGTFVNDKPVNGEWIDLSNGDIIFIMGLKIIFMGNGFYINNPLNSVGYNSQCFTLIRERNREILNKLDEENIDEIYKEEDYFFRSPRLTNLIETEKVKIDSPPQIQDKEEMPLILTLGSSLSMGIVMMISMVTAIQGRMNGTASTMDTVFSVLMSLVMLMGMILFPILTMKWEKKRKKKYEKKRQTKYREYINSKIATIDEIMDKQRNILYNNYVSSEECAKIIMDREPRLWERKIEDYDFLSVRLGIGEVPLKIDIQYPEERFTMDEDDLVDILNDITNKSKILNNAPIVLSLVEKNISALISKDEELMKKIMQNIIIQLITFQSYEDLKLVFLLKEDKQKDWEYVKMLPHVWNNTKQIRFFADEDSDMEEISRYLEEEFQTRSTYEDDTYKSFMPYYLIITDDYKKVANLRIIGEVLKAKKNIGFSILCLTQDMMQLPTECKTFASIENNGQGRVFESEISSTNQQRFELDISDVLYFEKIAQKISNIPIKYTASSKILLPNSFTFLEMYDVGLIEQLNIIERWNKNDSTLSLQAPIGIDYLGRLITLDIHEKFHGPHGLIAGATGSGKSEFIITYILSLAINYRPDDVNFILIDYKGGGLAGAFQKRNIKLPHLVGTITNIDTNGLQRSLASIQSELKRRQIIFNEVRNKTDEGTIDIYKYQKLYHDGVVDKPVPHLLIICDEFAELKQQQEEFMDELMSVSRIGRSLGVHLILATQKPAGIVNDQIRSNSKFAVCLKVQDAEDSRDVIKRPDAANLKNAGQFYLQVGNDEYFVLGQSAWSGAPYFPSDTTKKNEDTSIEVISNIGTVIKKADNAVQKIAVSKGEQLTNIVKYIYDLAEQENIHAENLWLENIPETIFVQQLRKKYRIKPQENEINLIIGEYDDPANQRQGPVNLNFSTDGNTIIYGNAESGKETLLSTIIYDAMTTYTSEEIWMYALDFGSEALKIFKDAPHVGDVIFANESEKITRFFDMIQNEIKRRRAILSDYSGDYKLYISKSGKAMPMIAVIINNYEAFSEIYEDDFEDIISSLTREGTRCGIIFIITASAVNDLRYRLSQNFKRKIVLQMNSDDDYFSIFDNVGKKRPSHIFGRGLITLENNEIYEFQTAKICEADKWNAFIRDEIDGLNERGMTKAENIPVIPNKVTFEDVKNELKDITSVPIGITKKELKPYAYNFKKDFINVIASKNIENGMVFISHIIEEIQTLPEVNLTILDAERTKQSKKELLSANYGLFKSKMGKNTGGKNKHNLCIIIGLDKFLNYIDDGEFGFIETLKKAEELENYSFIIVESATKLKNHEYEEWYKNYINTDNGIWIGNGIDDQYLINISSDERNLINNCGYSFGYVIKNEQPVFVKLLEMKEKGDDNE